MKKLAILLFACLWGFGAIATKPINLGIHGGVSSNRINFHDLRSVHGSQANTGYMIGAFMRANLGKIYLEPALNYAHKKSTAEGYRKVETPKENFNLEMNTFDIPVMVGFHILDISAVKIRLFLGPQLSVGKIKNLKRLGEISADKANLRGKAGIGLDIWKLTFDADYEKGLQKLSHELKSPRSFNFTLGFKII